MLAIAACFASPYASVPCRPIQAASDGKENAGLEASLAGATGDLWDVAPLAWSSVCRENAVVLAPIKDAEKAARPRPVLARQLMWQRGIFLEMFVRCT